MKHRITFLLGKIDNSICPPPVLSVIYPEFNGWPTILSESEIIVEVPDGTIPIEVSPLIRVELLNEESN